MSEEMKTCSVCMIDKPLSKFEMFHNKILNKTYPRNKCKKCINTERRQRREGKETERVRIIDVTEDCMSGIRTRFNRQSKFDGLNVDYSFMTVDWYNAELVRHKNACGICGKTPQQLGRRLVVDHSHTTGKYRGLLCHNCNGAMGVFGDSIEGVEKVLQYLKTI